MALLHSTNHYGISLKEIQFLKKLFDKVSELKSVYDQQREKDRFNIISALHKERDEVYLHSRMISYLLSPISGHGMENLYLKLFVRDILNLESEQFDISNVKVLPNENRKSEYKEIDLLLVNKYRSQAIIIENKIDAKDSNHASKRDGYRGQMERYYNTIKLGIDKDGNECKDFQCNQVYVYYLSLNKRPSDISVGVLKDKPGSWNEEKNILSYDFHIREWLKKSIENTPDEKLQVKIFIQHYLKLIDRLTHNDIPMEEREELKNIVADNISDTKYLIDNFKHVKWHTVHEFWTTLKFSLEKQFKEVVFFSDAFSNADFEQTITEVAHNSKDVNYGFTFYVEDKKAYISGKGNLSWGLVNPKKWSNFNTELIEGINFSEFSSECTYNLINRTNMNNAINLIIAEINKSVNNDFENLIID